ncbi:MAG: hypothetical protein KDA81_03670 [Planctomycetaceae bacterium]|nr:hypothetical protein [Planctomycetaceae bacterium]
MSHTIADEKADAKPDTDMQQIDAWVEQLGHQTLTKRVQAKKELLNAGKTAIPSLAKAALSDKREAIERSIDILGALAQSKDEETADAARVTLKMLSESKQPSTAERAKSVLNTKEADGIKPFEGWDKAGTPFAGGGGTRSVSVSNVNGVRTITVVENGRETFIQEVPGRGIRVKTEDDGKPIDVIARNAADLEKRLPEVHELYKQATSGPGLTTGFGQVGAFPFANANAVAIANCCPPSTLNSAGQVSANQMLLQQLNELKRRMAGNPAMQQLLDQQIQAMSKD